MYMYLNYNTSTACRMLVLNCSGSSAIIHIEIMQQLMMRSGRKIFDMFEWIVATGFSAVFILLMMYGETIFVVVVTRVFSCIFLSFLYVQ